ncbi:hypothetical protein EOA33_32695 [Mesorhizobium sp. M4A.F.Ca.ET.050.02.1.1]|uniref:hypothetical protein n=1 Tax=Mesorhizobium sp. M4A.F.Ca.ET.050.02.1.1 TaxID=2496754 RepID=UPI000FCAF0D6|nr:hypothetical protein [Mesorhizobium sp. M4A.F.Ca.ET.050.02.1.1]RUX42142.1 hypothetical protein EOA33_32695 [Mesorhizobium sp. M4A.F.Ca.ET.050.02.1.1]
MSWISWPTAVATVRLKTGFAQNEAEQLLQAAIREDRSVEVRADEHPTYIRPRPDGQWLPVDEPEFCYGFFGGRAADATRPYRRVNEVDLPSLRAWLSTLTSEPTTQDVKGDVGRPDRSWPVLGELQRRVAAGEVCEKLADEARYLTDWLSANHRDPDWKPVSVGTIENRIRDEFNRSKAARARKAADSGLFRL